jgi:DNA-binding transcriptional MerR regulator
MKAEGYSIKDLEVLSGVKAHTIRIWEKRYRLLTPGRTDTNIRYYNDDDLRRILNISLLVKNRYKISKVAKWSELQIRNTVLEVTGKSTSESDYVDRLILFMLNFDNQGFYRLTTEIIIEKGLEEALTKVIFSLFERIGTYWMVGSIFPAQEHNITNIIRQKLIVEIDKLGVEATRNSSVLFFLPDNELHEMGLLFYTYITRKMGYNVVYLGQFVPFDDLLKITSHIKIDYVFTAFVNSITKSDLEQYLIKLKETFVQQKIFITGWQVQHHMPQLPRSVKIIKDYRELQKYLG